MSNILPFPFDIQKIIAEYTYPDIERQLQYNNVMVELMSKLLLKQHQEFLNIMDDMKPDITGGYIYDDDDNEIPCTIAEEFDYGYMGGYEAVIDDLAKQVQNHFEKEFSYESCPYDLEMFCPLY